MVSEDGLKVLKILHGYNALDNEDPSPELDCPWPVLKELNKGGFIRYQAGGMISITLEGVKALEPYL